jgi:hypothetical protein
VDSILHFCSLLLHGFLVPFDLLLALCDCSDTVSANLFAVSEHSSLPSNTTIHASAGAENALEES